MDPRIKALWRTRWGKALVILGGLCMAIPLVMGLACMVSPGMLKALDDAQKKGSAA